MGESTRIWHSLIEDIESSWPSQKWANLGVLVGCSGGADSVALLRALVEIRRKNERTPSGFVVAAHFHHGIRGEESDVDARFTESLANDLGIRFVCGRGTGHHSDESALRNQRYAFFHETAQATGSRYIALAHSLDDNVETVLHNLMRGTGPAGMAGIAAARLFGDDLMQQDFVIVRPLLRARRKQIRAALEEIGQLWREDSSNQNTRYRRNWIRQEVLPQIESQYPNASEAIGRSIDLHNDWRDVMKELATQWMRDNIQSENPLSIRRGDETAPAIVIFAAQALWQRIGWPTTQMNRVHWQRLARSIRYDESSRFTLPGDIDVDATGALVILKPATR